MIIQFTQLIVTLISFAAMMILMFALFSLPIKGNDKQIMVLSLSVGITNYYLKFVEHSPYFFIIQIAIMIVMLSIIKNYPILYSLIMSITSMFIFSVIDSLFTMIYLKISGDSIKQITGQISGFVATHIGTTILYLLVAAILTRLHVGFTFISRKFSSRMELSSYVWLTIVIIGMLVFQLSVFEFSDVSSYKYIAVAITLVLLGSVYYSYRQNKKHRGQKYANMGR